VTVVTTSREKTNDAKRFGAKAVIINRDGADWTRLGTRSTLRSILSPASTT